MMINNLFYKGKAFITVFGEKCFCFSDDWDDSEGLIWYYYHPYFNIKVLDKRPLVKQFIKDLEKGIVSANDFYKLFYDKVLISYGLYSTNPFISLNGSFLQKPLLVVIEDCDGEYVPSKPDNTDILYFSHFKELSVPNYKCLWKTIHFIKSEYYEKELDEKQKEILEIEKDNICFIGHLLYSNSKLEKYRKE